MRVSSDAACRCRGVTTPSGDPVYKGGEWQGSDIFEGVQAFPPAMEDTMAEDVHWFAFPRSVLLQVVWVRVGACVVFGVGIMFLQVCTGVFVCLFVCGDLVCLTTGLCVHHSLSAAVNISLDR